MLSHFSVGVCYSCVPDFASLTSRKEVCFASCCRRVTLIGKTGKSILKKKKNHCKFIKMIGKDREAESSFTCVFLMSVEILTEK